MADNDLTGKVGLDTTDFKTAIAGMNRDIRVIESGFRASAAALGDWGKSASGLEMRIKALTDEMVVQQGKVNALRGEYEKIAKEKGATSRAAQDLEIRLNKETETLNKMGLELNQTETALSQMGNESTETAGDVDKLDKEEEQTIGTTGRLGAAMASLKGHLAAAGTGFKELGNKVLSVTKNIAVGLAAAATGAAVALGALVLKTAAEADELVEMSDKTGLSVTQLQELKYIGEQTGTELETVTGSLAKMIRSMASAEKGTGAQSDAFKSLGVSVVDVNGNLRDSQDVFGDVLNALGGIANETERDALAMAIFGKSAQELNPLIKLGADGMADMAAEAKGLGAIMSEDAVRGAADLNDKIAGLKAGMAGMAGTIGAALAPAITKIIGKFQEWLASPKVQEGLKNLVEGIGRVADTVGEVVSKLMSGDIAGALGEIFPPATVDQIMNVADAIGKFINETLIPFVTQHAEEIKGAIIAIAAVLAGAGIVALIASIANPIGLIIAAVGLLGAAWAGNWGGIRDKTQAVVEWLKPYIANALAAIQKWWADHGAQVLAALKAAWDGIVAAVKWAIDTIKLVVKAWQAVFKGDWEGFGKIILEIWGRYWELLKTAVIALWDFLKGWIPKLGRAIVDWFSGIDWKQIGTGIVTGIWDGISKGWTWLKKMITIWVGDFLEYIQGLLGIRSPSKVFSGYGKALMMGLQEGIRKNARLPELELARMAGRLEGVNLEVGRGQMTEDRGRAMESSARTGEVMNNKRVTIFGGVHVTNVDSGGDLLEGLMAYGS